jgi:hypothetical protein
MRMVQAVSACAPNCPAVAISPDGKRMFKLELPLPVPCNEQEAALQFGNLLK